MSYERNYSRNLSEQGSIRVGPSSYRATEEFTRRLERDSLSAVEYLLPREVPQDPRAPSEYDLYRRVGGRLTYSSTDDSNDSSYYRGREFTSTPYERKNERGRRVMLHSKAVVATDARSGERVFRIDTAEKSRTASYSAGRTDVAIETSNRRVVAEAEEVIRRVHAGRETNYDGQYVKTGRNILRGVVADAEAARSGVYIQTADYTPNQTYPTQEAADNAASLRELTDIIISKSEGGANVVVSTGKKGRGISPATRSAFARGRVQQGSTQENIHENVLLFEDVDERGTDVVWVTTKRMTGSSPEEIALRLTSEEDPQLFAYMKERFFKNAKPKAPEYNDYAIGLFSGLYRANYNKETLDGRRLEKDASGTVFLPTKLSDDYFSRFKRAPAPTPYQDYFYALTGEVPKGDQAFWLKEMDRQLSPSLGELRGLGIIINQTFGEGLYKDGEGLLTVGLKGLGRLLDIVTGHYTMEQIYDLEQGKGPKNDLVSQHRAQYKADPNRGFFENTLGNTSKMISDTAGALVFYFGVSHAISMAKANIETMGVSAILEYANNDPNGPADVRGALYGRLFSDGHIDLFQDIRTRVQSRPGSGFSETLVEFMQEVRDFADPTASRTSLPQYRGATGLQQRMGDRLRDYVAANPSTDLDAAMKQLFGYDYAKGVMTFDKTLGEEAVSSAGSLHYVSKFRRIDQANIGGVVLPILQHIAVVGDDNLERNKFRKSVEDLLDLSGEAPALRFAEDGILTNASFENYGKSRLIEIARSLDTLAEFVPRNPLLWLPGIRAAVGFNELRVKDANGDIVDDYSLKTLMGPGFEGMIRKTDTAIRTIKNVFQRGVYQSYKDIRQLFSLEGELRRTEATLAQALLDNPYDHTVIGAQTSRLKALTQEHKSIRALYTSSLVEDLPVNTAAANLRGGLAALASVFLFDRFLSSTVMSNDGVDLVAQLMYGLKYSRDGSYTNKDKAKEKWVRETPVSQIEYTGTMPYWVKYPTILAAGAAGGHFFFAQTSEQLSKYMPRGTDTSPLVSTLQQAVSSIYNPDPNAFVASPRAVQAPLGAQASNAAGIVSQSSVQAARAYEEAVQAISTPRTGVRFSWFGAAVGAMAGLFAMQTAFNTVAAAANLFSRHQDGLKADDKIVASTIIARGIRNRVEQQRRVLAAEDRVDGSTPAPTDTSDGNREIDRIINSMSSRTLSTLGTVSYLAETLAQSSLAPGKVMTTFAHQVPNPIFQIAFVSKIDERGNTYSFGAGFQFLPILGAGSIPAFPLALRIGEVRSRRQKLGEFTLLRARQQALTPEEEDNLRELRDSRNPSRYFTSFMAGGLFTFDKDSQFMQAMTFAGTASILGDIYNRFRPSDSIDPATLAPDARNLRKLRIGAEFVAQTVEQVARISQAPILSLPNVLMKEVAAFAGDDVERFFTRIGPGARKMSYAALPLLFAWAATSRGGTYDALGSGYEAEGAAAGMVETEEGWKRAQSYRFGTMLGLAGWYGAAMQQGKVFNAASSFYDAQADGILGVGKTQQRMYNIYRDAAVSNLKHYVDGVPTSGDDVLREFVGSLNRADSARQARLQLKVSVMDQWLAKLAKPVDELRDSELNALISKANQFLGDDEKIALGDDARTELRESLRRVQQTAQPSMFLTSGLRLRMIGKQFVKTTAALGFAGITLAAFTSFMDEKGDNAFIKGLLAGPLKVVSGAASNEEESDPQVQAYRKALGIKSYTKSVDSSNYVSTVAKFFLGGVFALTDAVGLTSMYKDNPKAFINVFGPVGVSEGKGGWRSYIQAQGLAVDISGSQYSMGRSVMSRDFAHSVRAILETNPQNPEAAYMAFRGATVRQKPMSTYGNMTTSEEQALAGTSQELARAAEVRQYMAQGLKWQRGRELALDYVRDMMYTGRIQTRIGSVTAKERYKEWSPYDFKALFVQMVDPFVEDKKRNELTLERMRDALGGLVRFMDTGSFEPRQLDPTGLLYNERRQGTPENPLVKLFNDLRRISSGTISKENEDDNSTINAATGVVMLTQTVLLGAATAASFTYGLGTAVAALAAYHEGGVVTEKLDTIADRTDSIRATTMRFALLDDGRVVYTSRNTNRVGAYVTNLPTNLQPSDVADYNRALENINRRLSTIVGGEQPSASTLAQSLNTHLNDLTIDNNQRVARIRADLKAQIKDAFTFQLSQGQTFLEAMGLEESTLDRILDQRIDSFATSVLSDLDTHGGNLTPARALGIIENAAGVILDVQQGLGTVFGGYDPSIVPPTPDVIRNQDRWARVSRENRVRTRIFADQLQRRQREGIFAARQVNEILSQEGYLGAARGAALGAVELGSKALEISQVWYPLLSSMTAAATGNAMERKRASHAAAGIAIDSAFALGGFGLFGLATANVPLTAGIAVAGVGAYLIDDRFFRGAGLKAVRRGIAGVDRQVKRFERTLGNVINRVTEMPVLQQLLQVGGLPFRALDPYITSIHKGVQGTPWAMLTSLFLPHTTESWIEKMAFENFQKKTQFGREPYESSSFEISEFWRNRNIRRRTRAFSPYVGIDTEMVHPFLLGQITNDIDRSTYDRFFDTKGYAERVLQPFGPKPYMSQLLQLAAKRRNQLADYYIHGAYARRRDPVSSMQILPMLTMGLRIAPHVSWSSTGSYTRAFQDVAQTAANALRRTTDLYNNLTSTFWGVWGDVGERISTQVGSTVQGVISRVPALSATQEYLRQRSGTMGPVAGRAGIAGALIMAGFLARKLLQRDNERPDPDGIDTAIIATPIAGVTGDYYIRQGLRSMSEEQRAALSSRAGSALRTGGRLGAMAAFSFFLTKPLIDYAWSKFGWDKKKDEPDYAKYGAYTASTAAGTWYLNKFFTERPFQAGANNVGAAPLIFRLPRIAARSSLGALWGGLKGHVAFSALELVGDNVAKLFGADTQSEEYQRGKKDIYNLFVGTFAAIDAVQFGTRVNARNLFDPSSVQRLPTSLQKIADDITSPLRWATNLYARLEDFLTPRGANMPPGLPSAGGALVAHDGLVTMSHFDYYKAMFQARYGAQINRFVRRAKDVGARIYSGVKALAKSPAVGFGINAAFLLEGYRQLSRLDPKRSTRVEYETATKSLVNQNIALGVSAFMSRFGFGAVFGSTLSLQNSIGESLGQNLTEFIFGEGKHDDIRSRTALVAGGLLAVGVGFAALQGVDTGTDIFTSVYRYLSRGPNYVAYRAQGEARAVNPLLQRFLPPAPAPYAKGLEGARFNTYGAVAGAALTAIGSLGHTHNVMGRSGRITSVQSGQREIQQAQRDQFIQTGAAFMLIPTPAGLAIGAAYTAMGVFGLQGALSSKSNVTRRLSRLNRLTSKNLRQLSDYGARGHAVGSGVGLVGGLLAASAYVARSPAPMLAKVAFVGISALLAKTIGGNTGESLGWEAYLGEKGDEEGTGWAQLAWGAAQFALGAAAQHYAWKGARYAVTQRLLPPGPDRPLLPPGPSGPPSPGGYPGGGGPASPPSGGGQTFPTIPSPWDEEVYSPQPDNLNRVAAGKSSLEDTDSRYRVASLQQEGLFGWMRRKAGEVFSTVSRAVRGAFNFVKNLFTEEGRSSLKRQARSFVNEWGAKTILYHDQMTLDMYVKDKSKWTYVEGKWFWADPKSNAYFKVSKGGEIFYIYNQTIARQNDASDAKAVIRAKRAWESRPQLLKMRSDLHATPITQKHADLYYKIDPNIEYRGAYKPRDNSGKRFRVQSLGKEGFFTSLFEGIKDVWRGIVHTAQRAYSSVTELWSGLWDVKASADVDQPAPSKTQEPAATFLDGRQLRILERAGQAFGGVMAAASAYEAFSRFANRDTSQFDESYGYDAVVQTAAGGAQVAETFVKGARSIRMIRGIGDLANVATIGFSLYRLAVSKDEKERQQATRDIGGSVGALAGGIAGGAVGSLFGPVGTMVGSIAGSFVGDTLGRAVAADSLSLLSKVGYGAAAGYYANQYKHRQAAARRGWTGSGENQVKSFVRRKGVSAEGLGYVESEAMDDNVAGKYVPDRKKIVVNAYSGGEDRVRTIEHEMTHFENEQARAAADLDPTSPQYGKQLQQAYGIDRKFARLEGKDMRAAVMYAVASLEAHGLEGLDDAQIAEMALDEMSAYATDFDTRNRLAAGESLSARAMRWIQGLRGSRQEQEAWQGRRDKGAYRAVERALRNAGVDIEGDVIGRAEARRERVEGRAQRPGQSPLARIRSGKAAQEFTASVKVNFGREGLQAQFLSFGSVATSALGFVEDTYIEGKSRQEAAGNLLVGLGVGAATAVGMIGLAAVAPAAATAVGIGMAAVGAVGVATSAVRIGGKLFSDVKNMLTNREYQRDAQKAQQGMSAAYVGMSMLSAALSFRKSPLSATLALVFGGMIAEGKGREAGLNASRSADADPTRKFVDALVMGAGWAGEQYLYTQVAGMLGKKEGRAKAWETARSLYDSARRKFGGGSPASSSASPTAPNDVQTARYRVRGLGVNRAADWLRNRKQAAVAYVEGITHNVMGRPGEALQKYGKTSMPYVGTAAVVGFFAYDAYSRFTNKDTSQFDDSYGYNSVAQGSIAAASQAITSLRGAAASVAPVNALNRIGSFAALGFSLYRLSVAKNEEERTKAKEDIAGGVGGVIGGYVGTALGSAFGPVGSVMGGFAGSVVGDAVGRLIAKDPNAVAMVGYGAAVGDYMSTYRERGTPRGRGAYARIDNWVSSLDKPAAGPRLPLESRVRRAVYSTASRVRSGKAVAEFRQTLQHNFTRANLQEQFASRGFAGMSALGFVEDVYVDNKSVGEAVTGAASGLAIGAGVAVGMMGLAAAAPLIAPVVGVGLAAAGLVSVGVSAYRVGSKYLTDISNKETAAGALKGAYTTSTVVANLMALKANPLSALATAALGGAATSGYAESLANTMERNLADASQSQATTEYGIATGLAAGGMIRQHRFATAIGTLVKDKDTMLGLGKFALQKTGEFGTFLRNRFRGSGRIKRFILGVAKGAMEAGRSAVQWAGKQWDRFDTFMWLHVNPAIKKAGQWVGQQWRKFDDFLWLHRNTTLKQLGQRVTEVAQGAARWAGKQWERFDNFMWLHGKPALKKAGEMLLSTVKGVGQWAGKQWDRLATFNWLHLQPALKKVGQWVGKQAERLATFNWLHLQPALKRAGQWAVESAKSAGKAVATAATKAWDAVETFKWLHVDPAMERLGQWAGKQWRNLGNQAWYYGAVATRKAGEAATRMVQAVRQGVAAVDPQVWYYRTTAMRGFDEGLRRVGQWVGKQWDRFDTFMWLHVNPALKKAGAQVMSFARNRLADARKVYLYGRAVADWAGRGAMEMLGKAGARVGRFVQNRMADVYSLYTQGRTLLDEVGKGAAKVFSKAIDLVQPAAARVGRFIQNRAADAYSLYLRGQSIAGGLVKSTAMLMDKAGKALGEVATKVGARAGRFLRNRAADAYGLYLRGRFLAEDLWKGATALGTLAMEKLADYGTSIWKAVGRYTEKGMLLASRIGELGAEFAGKAVAKTGAAVAKTRRAVGSAAAKVGSTIAKFLPVIETAVDVAQGTFDIYQGVKALRRSETWRDADALAEASSLVVGGATRAGVSTVVNLVGTVSDAISAGLTATGVFAPAGAALYAATELAEMAIIEGTTWAARSLTKFAVKQALRPKTRQERVSPYERSSGARRAKQRRRQQGQQYNPQRPFSIRGGGGGGVLSSVSGGTTATLTYASVEVDRAKARPSFSSPVANYLTPEQAAQLEGRAVARGESSRKRVDATTLYTLSAIGVASPIAGIAAKALMALDVILVPNAEAATASSTSSTRPARPKRPTREIQQELYSKGYFSKGVTQQKAVDNKWGPLTEAAYRRYLADKTKEQKTASESKPTSSSFRVPEMSSFGLRVPSFTVPSFTVPSFSMPQFKSAPTAKPKPSASKQAGSPRKSMREEFNALSTPGRISATVSGRMIFDYFKRSSNPVENAKGITHRSAVATERDYSVAINRLLQEKLVVHAPTSGNVIRFSNDGSSNPNNRNIRDNRGKRQSGGISEALVTFDIINSLGRFSARYVTAKEARALGVSVPKGIKDNAFVAAGINDVYDFNRFVKPKDPTSVSLDELVSDYFSRYGRGGTEAETLFGRKRAATLRKSRIRTPGGVLDSIASEALSSGKQLAMKTVQDQALAAQLEGAVFESSLVLSIDSRVKLSAKDTEKLRSTYARDQKGVDASQSERDQLRATQVYQGWKKRADSDAVSTAARFLAKTEGRGLFVLNPFIGALNESVSQAIGFNPFADLSMFVHTSRTADKLGAIVEESDTYFSGYLAKTRVTDKEKQEIAAAKKRGKTQTDSTKVESRLIGAIATSNAGEGLKYYTRRSNKDLITVLTNSLTTHTQANKGGKYNRQVGEGTEALQAAFFEQYVLRNRVDGDTSDKREWYEFWKYDTRQDKAKRLRKALYKDVAGSRLPSEDKRKIDLKDRDRVVQEYISKNKDDEVLVRTLSQYASSMIEAKGKGAKFEDVALPWGMNTPEMRKRVKQDLQGGGKRVDSNDLELMRRYTDPQDRMRMSAEERKKASAVVNRVRSGRVSDRSKDDIDYGWEDVGKRLEGREVDAWAKRIRGAYLGSRSTGAPTSSKSIGSSQKTTLDRANSGLEGFALNRAKPNPPRRAAKGTFAAPDKRATREMDMDMGWSAPKESPTLGEVLYGIVSSIPVLDLFFPKAAGATEAQALAAAQPGRQTKLADSKQSQKERKEFQEEYDRYLRRVNEREGFLGQIKSWWDKFLEGTGKLFRGIGEAITSGWNKAMTEAKKTLNSLGEAAGAAVEAITGAIGEAFGGGGGWSDTWTQYGKFLQEDARLGGGSSQTRAGFAMAMIIGHMETSTSPQYQSLQGLKTAMGGGGGAMIGALQIHTGYHGRLTPEQQRDLIAGWFSGQVNRPGAMARGGAAANKGAGEKINVSLFAQDILEGRITDKATLMQAMRTRGQKNRYGLSYVDWQVLHDGWSRLSEQQISDLLTYVKEGGTFTPSEGGGTAGGGAPSQLNTGVNLRERTEIQNVNINLPGQGRIIVTEGFFDNDRAHSAKGGQFAIFGDSPNKVTTLGAGHWNIGLDYVVPGDRKVKANMSGRVISSQIDGGYGNRVVLETDYFYNLNGKRYRLYQHYAHLANGGKAAVGQRLSEGGFIGTMGGTGSGGKNVYGAHVDSVVWFKDDKGRKVYVSPNIVFGSQGSQFVTKADGTPIATGGGGAAQAQSSSRRREAKVIKDPQGKGKSITFYRETEVKQGDLRPVGNGQSLRKDAAQAFNRMVAEARKENINLTALSGFRSVQTQEGIWRNKVKQMGEYAAAKTSAPPGFSEHHTGTAVDINSLSQGFANTREYRWLQRNAAKYNFHLSYGHGNEQGVSFEPWHWQYRPPQQAQPSQPQFPRSQHGGVGAAPASGRGRGTVQGKLSAKEKLIADYLANQNFSKAGIAAVLGSFKQESGFNPRADNRTGNFGLAQWGGKRRANMPRITGNDTRDTLAQLDYMMAELRGKNNEGKRGKLLQVLQSTNSVDAAMKAMWEYERYGPYGSGGRRYEYARQYMQRITGVTSTGGGGGVVSSASSAVSQAVFGAPAAAATAPSGISHSGQSAVVQTPVAAGTVLYTTGGTPRLLKATSTYANTNKHHGGKKEYTTKFGPARDYQIFVGGRLAGNTTRTATDARVSFVGNRGGYGKVVELVDMQGKPLARFAHLASYSVKAGQTLRAGDILGVQGGTGGGYAIHIHLEASAGYQTAWIQGTLTGKFRTGGVASTASGVVAQQQGVVPKPRNFAQEANSLVKNFGYPDTITEATFRRKVQTYLERGYTPDQIKRVFGEKFPPNRRKKVGSDKPAKVSAMPGAVPQRVASSYSPTTTYSDNVVARADVSDRVTTHITETEREQRRKERQATIAALSDVNGRIPANLVSVVVDAQNKREAMAKREVEKELAKTQRVVTVPRPAEVHQAGDVNYNVAAPDASPARKPEVEKVAQVKREDDGRTVIKIEYRESPGSEMYAMVNNGAHNDDELSMMEPQRAARDSSPRGGKDVFGQRLYNVS